jgi:hypothetical protein
MGSESHPQIKPSDNKVSGVQTWAAAIPISVDQDGPSGATLPRICLKTNQPVSDEDMIQTELTWCSPWVGLLILVSGLLLIFVYFFVRKKCAITYGLHPSLRLKYRRRSRVKIIAAIIFVLALPLIIAFDSTSSLIFIVLVLFIASVVAIFLGNSPLTVVHHRRGMFWVKGFSKAYFQSLELAR